MQNGDLKIILSCRDDDADTHDMEIRNSEATPMKAAILALALGLAAPAFAQELPEIHRTVPPNVESKVGSFAMWHIKGGNGRCSARGTPTLDISTPPKHGSVRFATGDVSIPEGSGCRNSVYGVVILYTPAPGFVGQDQFTYNRAPDAMTFNTVGRPPGSRTLMITVGQ
jgi:hypothetical protein